MTKEEQDRITHNIIGSAMEVHKIMGRDLLESVYHQCMKLLKCPKGILINFNCSNIFKEGQKTFVNEYFTNLLEH